MENEIILKKLIDRIALNNKAGLACYFRRIEVLFPIILQKMKINKEVSIPLFFGGRMNVITGELVSAFLINFSYSETALTALMLKLISKDNVILDIGTHFGYEALLSSKLVGENGSVICFEPNPAAFQIASKNFKRKSNIRLINSAIGDFDGTIKMQNRPIAESAFNSISVDNNGKNLIDVSIVTLDNQFKDRNYQINYIKCDVEGFELEVLKGGTRILKEDKPILVLEVDMPTENEGSNKRADELTEFLSKFDYEGYSFDFKNQNLVIDKLNSFKVPHANVLFVHKTKTSLLL